MRHQQRPFHVFAVCCIAAACLTTDASADFVDWVPKETLQSYMKMSLVDNTKVLAPAREAFDRGDLKECVRLLEEAGVKSGIMPHPQVQLTLWLLSAGRTANALQVLESVSLAEGDRPDVRFVFAEIARQQGRLFDAWMHALAGEQAKAPAGWDEEYAEHMMKLIGRSKALIADKRGDWKTSEQLFKRMIEQGIRTPEVNLALGRAAFFQDRPDEAFKYFQEATGEENVESIPELLMAALYESKGDTKKTEEWFQKGDSGGADHAERVRLEYARWLLRQNRSADARTAATKFRPLEKNLADFEYIVALCDRMEGQFPAAEKTLSRLHQSNPQNLAIGNQLALVLAESTDEGKRARALQIATTNARNQPNSVDAISTLGWLQHRLGDSAAANQTFNVILQGGQASRDVAYYVAQVRYAMGESTTADRLVKAAKESDGQFFNAFRVDQKKKN